MSVLQDFIGKGNTFLWSFLLIFLLCGTGIYYTIRLRFIQLRRLGEGFKLVFGHFSLKGEKHEKGEMSPFQAIATAIAAQVGTGNLAGAATAIVSGGPGAIFWMWVSAFFGMATIYGEAVLAQVYKEEKDGDVTGGPVYYIKAAFSGALGKVLAGLFAVFIILALGFMGNMVQSNSIGAAFQEVFHIMNFEIPPIAIGIFVAAIAAFIFLGGTKRLAAVLEKIVPIMAGVYILGAVVFILMHITALPGALASIFIGAFNPQAVTGAALGITIRQAIRFGVARGLFSNEAGMGSTPHAHALADVKDPCEQGFVAMAGVFVDTVLICTSTAFVIMLTGVYSNTSLKSVAITQQGFEIAFGEGGIIFLAISLIFFAFTTIIGWYMFAEMNIKFMFGKKGVRFYRPLVVLFVFLGCLFAADLVWELADSFNGLMVIPNLIGIIFLAPQVKKLYKNFLANRKKKEA